MRDPFSRGEGNGCLLIRIFVIATCSAVVNVDIDVVTNHRCTMNYMLVNNAISPDAHLVVVLPVGPQYLASRIAADNVP